MRYETQKLLDVYEAHGKIIVGVDFDDTIFPMVDGREETEVRARWLRETLRQLLEGGAIVLCLYTVADPQSMIYKEALMDEWKIPPHWVNNSPVSPRGKCNKPFFNILLDDKAGLNEAVEVLKEFHAHLFKNNLI
jgi:hypothetical protein